MPRVREFKIPRRLKRWKRRLKVYSRSFILYRDYSNLFTLSNGGEPFLRLKPSSDPSRQGNVKKITFVIKGRFMGILRAYLCFISLIHATWWDEPVSRQLYFAYFLRIFHVVVLDNEIWGSWFNEPSEMSKIWPKKDKVRIHILRFGFKYTLAFWVKCK